MVTVEFLATGNESILGTACINAGLEGAAQAGLSVIKTDRYLGTCDWLCIYGAGDPKRNAARLQHLNKKRKVACFDLGYLRSNDKPTDAFLRVSINELHPSIEDINRTPSDPQRWLVHGFELTEDYDPNGPVIVVGLGPKSRTHLGEHEWEVKKLRTAKVRFPDRKIIYRPKPQGQRDKHIAWEPRDGFTPIKDLLKGASLVICRHSNVAVDAALQGIPVECDAGAARWLYSVNRNPTREKRLDFLQRISWWQWQATGAEMKLAWEFLLKVTND